jgi:2-phospho-L-lactate/phosphoenolpyruvate guanylyltransferase
MSLTTLGDLAGRVDQRGGVCVLIAIKERSHCKTRLEHSLGPAARLELVRSMFTAVLSAAQAARTVRQIIVVSPERDSVPAQIPVLADTGECLNAALMQAHRVLLEFGSREVVVLPADLPNITAADIDALARAGRRGRFAIAPDTRGQGTNALYLVSSRPFRFQFGEGSRRSHVQEARRMGLTPRIVRLPGFEFDVDSTADLVQLDRQQWRARLQA